MDVLSSRDLDQLMTLRHADAVKGWLDSNKTFHVIRDLPAHHAAVLADYSVREPWKTSWDKAVKEPWMKPNASWGSDQRF